MEYDEIKREIAELEQVIASLPVGSVTYKTINGKKQPYLQWKEGGKTRSKYIKKEERGTVLEQIERRNAAIARIKLLRSELTGHEVDISLAIAFKTNVMVGELLAKTKNSVRGWAKRDCFKTLAGYLESDSYGRVCVLYGLRRTGKTTLIMQAISEMPEDRFDRTAYIKIKPEDSMGALYKDIEALAERNYKYIFIDEVTLMSDFIDGASMFSDVFAMQGIKIVLSGTDSLGFWITLDEELYDRAKPVISTTFIPFGEFARVLGKHDIDEYIRYGGTLRIGETAFDDDDAMAEDASFRDDESTRRYIDTAICRNIQHSLACYKDGAHLMALRELYEANELTGAINRVIEKSNHEFLIETLTEAFRSHDLGSARQLLRKEQNTVLDEIDIEAVTKRLMQLLEIKNKEDQNVGITQVHADQIKSYLKALGLVEDCDIRYESGKDKPYSVFTQPGMRYCQALALIHSLMKEEEFMQYSAEQRKAVTEKISNDVRGRMLEDIVLLETKKALPSKKYDVFKFVFLRGEYDMVVWDKDRLECRLYEIKHSSEISDEQTRYLTDEQKLKLIEHRFGRVIERSVLYRGKPTIVNDGIGYVNVEEYLSGIIR